MNEDKKRKGIPDWAEEIMKKESRPRYSFPRIQEYRVGEPLPLANGVLERFTCVGEGKLTYTSDGPIFGTINIGNHQIVVNETMIIPDGVVFSTEDVAMMFNDNRKESDREQAYRLKTEEKAKIQKYSVRVEPPKIYNSLAVMNNDCLNCVSAQLPHNGMNKK